LEKKKNLSYICYLDLLGTKALATSDGYTYVNNLRIFHSVIIKKCETYKIVKCFAFSDCAYIECYNLRVLCLFVSELRRELLKDNIFFNAAITTGSLGERETIKKRQCLINFENKDVVMAYSLQVNFSGIGIFVDSNLWNKPQISDLLMESKYVSINSKGEFVFLSYKDLKLSISGKEVFNPILHMFLETYTKNLRASRYYVSLTYSLLTELWNTSDETTRIELLKSYLDFLMCIGENQIKMDLVLMVINLICQLDSSFDLECKLDNISLFFDEIYNHFPSVITLNNLNQFSCELISDTASLMLSRYITRRILNKCNYSIPLDQNP